MSEKDGLKFIVNELVKRQPNVQPQFLQQETENADTGTDTNDSGKSEEGRTPAYKSVGSTHRNTGEQPRENRSPDSVDYESIGQTAGIGGGYDDGLGGQYITDAAGSVFDPAIHSAKDGKPTLTKRGNFRKKKGVSPSQSPNTELDPQILAAQQAGKVSAELVFTLGQTVFGREWAPKVQPSHGVDEPRMLTDAFAQYYLATGVREIPPWAGLAIALSAYSIPRLRGEETLTRLARIKQWLKSLSRKRT